MVNPSELPKELDQLRQKIEKLPASWRHQLLPLVTMLTHYMETHNRLLEIHQEALSQAELDAKYLQFDLEATRHERDELQEDCKALWRRLDGET